MGRDGDAPTVKRVNLRIPEKLYNAIAEEMAATGRSLSSVIRRSLSERYPGVCAGAGDPEYEDL